MKVFSFYFTITFCSQRFISFQMGEEKKGWGCCGTEVATVAERGVEGEKFLEGGIKRLKGRL